MRYLIDTKNKQINIQGEYSFADIEHIKLEIGDSFNDYIISANQPTTPYIFPTTENRMKSPDYSSMNKKTNPFTIAGDTRSNLVYDHGTKYQPLWKKKKI